MRGIEETAAKQLSDIRGSWGLFMAVGAFLPDDVALAKKMFVNILTTKPEQFFCLHLELAAALFKVCTKQNFQEGFLIPQRV